MTTPSPDEHPTRVQQATVEQPEVTTVPATRRTAIWQRRVPARIGRARTSTVLIGCLFVLLYALNAGLPQADGGMTNVVLPSGRTVPVPNSALPSDARPTTTAPTAPSTTTDQAPPATSTSTPTTSTTAPRSTTSAPRTTTSAPRTTADQPTTTAPATSAPRSQEPTTSAPATSVAPTTRASTAPDAASSAPPS
jgi:hypothetical protein